MNSSVSFICYFTRFLLISVSNPLFCYVGSKEAEEVAGEQKADDTTKLSKGPKRRPSRSQCNSGS